MSDPRAFFAYLFNPLLLQSVGGRHAAVKRETCAAGTWLREAPVISPAES